MIVLGVGLVLALWVSSAGGDATLPAICVWNLQAGPEGVNPLGVAIFCLLGLFLVFSYGNNIISLYTRDPQLSMVEWAIDKLRTKLMHAHSKKTSCDEPCNGSIPVTAIDLLDCRKKRGLVHFTRDLGDPFSPSVLARLRRAFALGIYVHREISESFLNHILWLTFGNLYGIFQIIITRYSILSIEGNENDMTFGQVVSLLLLGLPLLTIGEAYYGVWRSTLMGYLVRN